VRPARVALASPSIIGRALRRGFARAGIVDPELLAPFAERLQAHGSGEPGWVTSPRSWSAASSILAVALAVRRTEADDPSVPGAPCGLVAPFARRNYYRAAAGLLDGLSRELAAEAGVARRSFRVCSNSRVPEKPMAAARGVAGDGANSLAIAPALGSLFVIGLLVMPFVVEPEPAQPIAPVDPCGPCRSCIDACPTGAIVERGLVDPERCLQGWAARPASLPERLREAWGTRLYGCQACQEACPCNRDAREGPAVSIGDIGAGVPLARVLGAGPAGLRELLRGSALDQRWIAPEALVRNALLAAGNRRDPAIRGQVQRYAASASPVLREAARWALDRLP
jgi:epoxyqueuosine reductase